MSTLSVTNINTANGTTDLSLKTGNSSGPVLVVGAGSNIAITNTTNILVGSNINITTNSLNIGNSTVNSIVNSTSLSVPTNIVVGNSTVNTIYTSSNITVGANIVINSSSIFAGNSSVNTNISNGVLIINGSNTSPVQSFRNKIINGNFDFWQRGTSFAGGTDYNSDRWISNNSGTNFSLSRQSFTLGQTAVPNEPTYFHRTIVTSVAGSGNFYAIAQKIESVRTLAGQTATFSFWAKADAAKNMAIEFIQNFGTGGSPSTAVNNIGTITCALTTSWQKFTITVNIPSISGKTLGSNNDDYLAAFFWLDAGSTYNSRTNSLGQQSGTFDIAQVQLEAGSVATPFEVRPMQVELALCQRYYNKSYSVSVTPGTVTGAGQYRCVTVAGVVWFNIIFPSSMRSTPTVTVYNPTTGGSGTYRGDLGGNYTPLFIEFSTFGGNISGLGDGGSWAYAHYIASAEL